MYQCCITNNIISLVYTKTLQCCYIGNIYFLRLCKLCYLISLIILYIYQESVLLFSFNKIYCFSSDACSGVRVAVSIGSMPVSTNTTEFNEGLVEDGLKCQINPMP